VLDDHDPRFPLTVAVEAHKTCHNASY
jgi:hypothetical protein